jgi:hypothetical protein
MRLSEWRAKAPFKDSVTPKVVAAIESALGVLGADLDPECWVTWGDDPRIRYQIFAATPAGLIHLNVRVGVPGEGPRASGKILRWNRVQLGELAVEIQAGHRLVTFQVEAQPFNGADAAADAIAAFAEALFAAVDGRPAPTPARKGRTSKASTSARSRTPSKPGTGGRSAATTARTAATGTTPPATARLEARTGSAGRMAPTRGSTKPSTP